MAAPEPWRLRQVLVGGYTADQGGSARGITCYRPTHRTSGQLELEPAGVLALPSPSYLVAHPSQPWLFAVSEASPASVASVRVGPDGSLTLISTIPSGGDGACHLALSPDATQLAVAHYGSGSVSSLAVDAEGRLTAQDVLSFSGRGTDPNRQEGPHAHQVVWSGDELWVADLGTDRLHRLRLGADGDLTTLEPPIELPPGSGPRHFVVTGEHLVVACELSGELWLARRADGGGWREVHSLPTSARGEPESLQPSALRCDGDQLFVANRGPRTVARFTLDRSHERLVPTAEIDCGGSGPRDLALTPDLVWVANQASDRVSVFARADPETGAPAFELASSSPACVLLLPAGER